MPDNSNPQSRGYPIGALFVLVALAAVLTVAVTPQVRELGRNDANVPLVIGAVGAGAFVGLFLGSVLGMLSHRWRVGLAVGPLTGLLLGIVAGLIGTTPPVHIPRIAVAMSVGSAIIVLVAYVMRRKE